MAQALFSTEEIEIAKLAASRLSKSTMRRAILLHNALRSFIRDVGSRVSATTHRTACFTDVSEIYSWIAPDEGSFNAFSFGDLLIPVKQSQSTSEYATELRRLIENLEGFALQKILFDARTQVGMVDSHVFEYRGVRESLKSKATNAREKLVGQTQPLFDTVQHSQFVRIREFLESRLDLPERKQPDLFFKEFDAFRESFIPDLSDELIKEYRSATAVTERLADFERVSRRGRLVQVGYGVSATLVAAFAKWGVIINQSDLKSFLDQSSTRDDFAAVRQIIVELARQVSLPRGTTLEARQTNILTDAHALAVLHTFNTFLKSRSQGLQFEFVSRSHTLQAVMATLPPDQLNVTVRHPLFLPEIYEFSENALAELRHLGVSVEGHVRPWIDATAQNADDNNRQADAASIDEATRAIRLLARDITRLLAEATTIQVSISPEGQDTLRRASQLSSQTSAPSLKDLVDLLELLARAMDERKSPLSERLLRDLGKRTIQLVQAENLQISKSTARSAVINFISAAGPNTHFPHDFARFRFTGGKLSRTFFLYGEKHELERVFGLSIPLLKSSRSQNIVRIKPSALIDSWLEVGAGNELEIGSDNDGAVLTRIQKTLLCALALAVEGRYTAAAAVASPILGTITRKLHVFDDGRGSDRDLFSEFGDEGRAIRDPRVALAYKELFLLRHYCERANGVVDFNNPGRDPFDVDGVRSFARAQRDLDFAILMSEQAHQLAARSSNSPVSKVVDDENASIAWTFASSGVQDYDDYRFPLINFAAWLDQLVFLLLRADERRDQYGGEFTGNLRRRHDLWVAAAFLKGVEVRAFRLAHLSDVARKLAADDGAKERFFAYHEARALSGLYIVLIVFLTFELSPEVQALWNPYVDLGPDRLLVFRNHRNWIERLRALDKWYKFTLRPRQVFEEVATCIDEIGKLRRKFKRIKPGDVAERQAFDLEYLAILDEFTSKHLNSRVSIAKEDVSDFSDEMLLSVVVKRLRERVGRLRVEVGFAKA